MVHHTEINSLIKKHSTEMYEQRVESQYQKGYMYFILLRLLMYISINMAKDIVNNMQMINTALSFW